MRELNRLHWALIASSWWLGAQGLLYAVLGRRLSGALGLRYQDSMSFYVHLAGLALLGLGYFVQRSVREASRQYLAVDSLVLVFLGLVISTLAQRLQGQEVLWFEWASLAANLALAAALFAFRLKPGAAPLPAVQAQPSAAGLALVMEAAKAKAKSEALPHLD